MRLLILLLFVSFTGTLLAQEKKIEKQPAAAKKAEKKAEKKPAKKTDKKEKTQAQPKQEWGRFSANARKDETVRAQKAEKKL
jgi:hypothetical protein